ncbi:MAG: efflux RND transporter periplasmic adaptor subunit [Bacteroidales bacterium]|nr:efflux RND transporter periplasmic adaptor subunit [Bacteroidales bacterium]
MKFLRSLPAIVLSVFILAGCGSMEGEKKNESSAASASAIKIEKVKVMALEPVTIGKNIEYTSTLKAFEEVHLVPSTPGRIEKIYVEVGSRVSKGDVLVQMDQIQLRQAIIQLQTLETDYKRLDTLQKVGSITRQQFDQISAQVEIARNNVEFLKENTRLVAPFGGIISGKYFENGEMYSGAPNTTAGKAAILSIVQINPLKAIVNIPETYFPVVNEGMKTQVLSDLYPGQAYNGQIMRKYPTIDPNTHSFQAEIRIENPGEKLRPGMFCRVELGFGEINALVVPALAVLKMQGSNERYIFLAEQGKAKRVSVTIGQRFDDKVEIVSNELKVGDKLIIAGQSRLVDQVPVEIVIE